MSKLSPLSLSLSKGGLLLATFTSTTAQAHSFGITYSLPVPFWLYGSGAAVALALSFVVAAVFMRRGAESANKSAKVIGSHPVLSGFVRLSQILALVFLAAAVITGLYGHPNSYANLNMTLFWIIFVLAFAYFTAVIGGLYQFANPWQNIACGIGKLVKPIQTGLFKYNAERFGYWPAIALYIAFIWVELFGATKPLSLAYYLMAYTGINVLGSLLWGIKDWFRYGEFFSVFLRMMALAAPFTLSKPEGGNLQLSLQWPFAQLLKETADHKSLVVFILFMLSSTAYDGLHETVPWQRLFWSQLLPTLDPSVLEHGLRAIITHRSWYDTYQWGSLILSPFVYLAAYLLALWGGKKLAKSDLSLSHLAVRFAYSLLPIALVYHVTHYYTLLQTQGLKVLALFSNPLGWDWNLFGTADWFKYPIIPDVSWVWHIQVITIVIGHIISVYIAHVEALRLFGDHRKATLSQLPMLLLMMAFTTAGLWILAQPIQSGL
ncbi:MAG: hypothetical protein OXT49_05720 [Gammaproteobacteria bacterium]|nr:hypothetical protein [Gammaproteobacteria bacterium]